MAVSNRSRALVLSGGGGRGAYHVGVLRFLEQHEWYPDVIAGTSIGAVNGAAIASGHTAHSLWALWKQLKTDDVQRRVWDLFSLDKWDHLLDTTPLRETLEREGWIDPTRINADPPARHLRITVVEKETGRLHVFGNSDDPSETRCEHVEINLDHILASCSIPVVYPSTQIKDTPYWDGGTVANTPLGPAVDAGAQDIVVVIMTPWEDDKYRPRYVHGGGVQGLLMAAQTAFEWALLASFQADLKLFRRTNELVQLRAENEALKAMLRERSMLPLSEGKVAALPHREIQMPVIISPQEPIPVADIIRYDPANHEKLYQMGYEDARAAWERVGRPVEVSAPKS
jgi:NTE family protein